MCSCGDIRQFRNEEALGSLTLDGFTATIIALGRGHVNVTGQPLHRRDVCAGIQQVADRGPAQVVRADKVGIDPRRQPPRLDGVRDPAAYV